MRNARRRCAGVLGEPTPAPRREWQELPLSPGVPVSRLPTAAPRHVRASHRIVGWAAFLLSIPVACHCVRTSGVETTDTRVFLHSVAGCALYGAFVAKVLVVRSRRLPAWMLRAAGSLLFGPIGLLWYSAALWALNGFTVPGG
ncbi:MULTISPECIES: DUF6529 family protein [unclassified Streptomyces]|uniref:DUF6529 family protein n=1 Tax=unclassified Streptomyces TaxID=2593676 RepID=UPI00370138B3